MFLPSSFVRMSTDSCLVNLVFFLFSMSFFPPSTLRSWTDPDLLKLLTFLPTFLFRSAVDRLWLRLLRNIIIVGQRVKLKSQTWRLLHHTALIFCLISFLNLSTNDHLALRYLPASQAVSIK